MTTTLLYSVKKKPETVKIPALFLKEASLGVTSQAFHVYRERSHTGLPQVQTRGQVSLTTKKMYKQKHTGNARHSSAKAPIFVGGGVTHGPKGVKSEHKLTKAMKALSKNGAIATKVSLKELFFVNFAGISKTKEAHKLLMGLSARSVLVLVTSKNWGVAKAFRNIPMVSVLPWETINSYPMITHHMVLVDSSVIEVKKPAKKKQI